MQGQGERYAQVRLVCSTGQAVTVTISVIPSHRTHDVAHVLEPSWDDFVSMLSEPLPATTPKGELPLWSPAEYRDRYVQDSNVLSVHALVFDVDEDPVPSAAELQEQVPWQAVAHTSSRATQDALRWRLVIAVSRPVKSDEYRRLWQFVADRLNFPVGASSKNPSRAWYFPRRGEDGTYEVVQWGKQPLDVEDCLSYTPFVQPALSIPAFAAATVVPDAPTLGPWVAPDALRPTLLARISEIAEGCRAACPTPGRRHELSLALAGALVSEDAPFEIAQEEVPAFVLLVCQAAGFGDSETKWGNAVRTVHRKRAGEPVQGFRSLRALFPGVARVVNPLWGPVDYESFRAGLQLASGAVAGPLTGSAVPSSALVLPSNQEVLTTNLQGPVSHPASNLQVIWGRWNEPLPELPYLVAGLIPEGKVIMFFAEGGSVKTWAAFALGISVATGAPWLGQYLVRQGRVLFLDYEDGRYEFQRRRGLLMGTEAPDVPELGYLYSGAKLHEIDTWTELSKLGLKLLVIDSLSAAAPSNLDENSREFIESVRLAGIFTEATGCTVLFVHHANKNGGVRGYSGIRDQADIVFRFEPVTESESGVKRMRMICDKPGPQKKPPPVNVELSDRGLGTFEDEASEASEVKLKDPRAAILLRLKDGPKTTLDEFKGVRRERLSAEIKALTDEGHLVKIEKGGLFEPGYQLDDDARRLERVHRVVEGAYARSQKTVEQSAHVPMSFVRRLFVGRFLDWSAVRRIMPTPRFHEALRRGLSVVESEALPASQGPLEDVGLDGESEQ